MFNIMILFLLLFQNWYCFEWYSKRLFFISGWTFTSLFREFPFLLKIAEFPLFYLFLYQPKEGAQTQIHLALSKNLDNLSGEYFVACRPSKTCPLAHDCQLAERLWSYSEQVVAPLFTKTDECIAM